MLQIQVLGSGLIPRGMGIAPRKEPFKADLTLIQTIMSTNGLKINYINPETGSLCPLTKSNLKRVWSKYGIKTENKKVVTKMGDETIMNKAEQVKPVAPVQPVKPEPKVPVVEKTVTQVKPVEPIKPEPKVEKKEDVKDNKQLRPVNAPESKKDK